MDLKLLTQADMILSKCGRPKAPAGSSVVYFPHGIPINAVIANLTTATYVKEVSGPTTWVLRAISSTLNANIFVQIELPNGQFLYSNYIKLSNVGGYGSFRYVLTEELECPPGSKIQLTLDTNISAPGASVSVSYVFEGAYKFEFKTSGVSTPLFKVGGQWVRRQVPSIESAAHLPRYFDGPQNIIAPCWAQGFGPTTPEGCQDSPFIYDSTVATLSVSAGAKTAQVVIQIEQATDFVCYRLLFDVLQASTVTGGRFLARIRAGSGYALNDEYFDVARYIGSAYTAKGWDIRAGDKVIIDLQLVDYAGTGNMTFQAFLDGRRRRKRAA